MHRVAALLEPRPSERGRGLPVDRIFAMKMEARMTSKHLKTKPQDRPRSDLDTDPGIGRSKGSFMTGEDPRDLDGGSTFQGDVENQTNPEGGVDPNRTGRTNK
jgi:hypothetical protein